jgi:hypothetical protein
MKKNFDNVKDSGKRQAFNTGSVRDTSEGKGMPHLIAGEAYAKIISKCNIKGDHLLFEIEKRLNLYNTIVKNKEENIKFIYESIGLVKQYIAKITDNTYYSIMVRLANHYANGAKKYAKNNWRKGQPISRYYDSAMRHLWKMIDGLEDEDHPAALYWNLLAIVQTKIDIEKGLLPKELNDFPFTIEETFLKKDK